MIQSDSAPTIVKVELEPKKELSFSLIGLPLLFLSCILTRPSLLSMWPLMLFLTIVAFIYTVFTYRLNAIEIDTSRVNVVLIETNLLQMKVKRTYSLNALSFTYKVGKISLYSRWMNICKLFINNKEIATITPDRDTWTDDSVNDLAKALVKAGVNKKFIGYSLKDAKIYDL